MHNCLPKYPVYLRQRFRWFDMAAVGYALVEHSVAGFVATRALYALSHSCIMRLTKVRCAFFKPSTLGQLFVFTI